MAWRRLMKFLHTLGGVGVTGALAAMMVLLATSPPVTELAAYTTQRRAIASVSEWLLFPSLGLVIVSGLLAIGMNRAFHDVGWVWLKLLLGVSAFEGTLVAVHGPATRMAERAEAALAGQLDLDALATPIHNEWGAMTIILGVAIANIVLGVWRPRFTRLPSASASRDDAETA
jgi:hypothetical protein